MSENGVGGAYSCEQNKVLIFVSPVVQTIHIILVPLVFIAQVVVDS
jgi:hypothetical protein